MYVSICVTVLVRNNFNFKSLEVNIISSKGYLRFKDWTLGSGLEVSGL